MYDCVCQRVSEGSDDVYESGDVYSSDPESTPPTSPPRTNVKPIPPEQRSLPPLPRDAERRSPLSGGLNASQNTRNKLLPEPPPPAVERPVSIGQQTKKTIQQPPPGNKGNTLGTITAGAVAQNKQAAVTSSKDQGRPLAYTVTYLLLMV